PVIEVLKTASPVASVGAPIEKPRKIVPSARARTASGRWGSNVGAPVRASPGRGPGQSVRPTDSGHAPAAHMGSAATTWEIRGRDGVAAEHRNRAGPSTDGCLLPASG